MKALKIAVLVAIGFALTITLFPYCAAMTGVAHDAVKSAETGAEFGRGVALDMMWFIASILSFLGIPVLTGVACMFVAVE